MTKELFPPDTAVESVVSTEQENVPRSLKAVAWLAAGGVALGLGFGGFRLLSAEKAPCESHTTLDGSFASTGIGLTLPSGSSITLDIFPKSSDINPVAADRKVKVAVNGDSHIIEAFNTPGPEAVFDIGDTKLLIDATGNTISTSCVVNKQG